MCHLRRNKSFVTKALRKPIMTNSRLENIYNKQRSHVNWVNNKNKDNNFSVTLLRKVKQGNFNNIDIISVSDNKKVLENNLIVFQ